MRKACQVTEQKQVKSNGTTFGKTENKQNILPEKK